MSYSTERAVGTDGALKSRQVGQNSTSIFYTTLTVIQWCKNSPL
jgi:hypothetical protein